MMGIERGMGSLARRSFLRSAALWCLGITASQALTACLRQVVVEKVIEKQVTKVVKEVVRETVIVETTPRVIEKTIEVEKTVEIEKLVTAIPALKDRVLITADVMDYSWTHFAMLKSAAFEELFPNIALKWRSLSGWHDYPRVVETLNASGQSGDLLEGPPGDLLAHWAERKFIRPLDEIISAEGFDASGIFWSMLASCRYRGQRIGLPYIGNAGENILLYNRRLFDEANLTRPNLSSTLDDLTKMGIALTRDRDGDGKSDQFGLALRFGLPSAYPTLHLFGAKLFSENSRECALNTPAGIEYLRWVHEQIHVHKLAPVPPQVEGSAVEMLRSGTVAMLRHSFRTFATLSASGERREIGATLFPKHPISGRVGTLASGLAYCIGQRSAIPNEVFQWCKFMSSREMGVQMFLGGYADPGCRSASWEDPRVLELYPLCAQVAGVADTAEVERLPWNLRLAECLDVWNRGIIPLAFDECTPEECASQIAQEINKVLALSPEQKETLWPR